MLYEERSVDIQSLHVILSQFTYYTELLFENLNTKFSTQVFSPICFNHCTLWRAVSIKICLKFLGAFLCHRHTKTARERDRVWDVLLCILCRHTSRRRLDRRRRQRFENVLDILKLAKFLGKLSEFLISFYRGNFLFLLYLPVLSIHIPNYTNIYCFNVYDLNVRILS